MLDLLTRPVVAARENFHSIDIMRGIAALCVLVFHTSHFVMGGGILSRPAWFLDDVWILQVLDPIRRHGSLAVMLFWSISGFVFMNIYADTRPGAKTFWVNRFSRLYPLHFTTLVLIAVIQMAAMALFGHYLIYRNNDPYHFVLQLFFASEWGFQDGRSFNGPIWSVSVEVLIYAVFFLFVRFVRVSLLINALAFAGFVILYKFVPRNMIVLCGVYFFSGMLFYSFYALTAARWRNRVAIGASIGVVLLAVGLATIGVRRVPLTLWLTPMFGLALYALAVSEAFAVMRRGYRRLRFLGDITYSSYLWHSPLQMLFLLGAGIGWWALDIAFTSAFMIAYFVVVGVFSYASFLWLERPAQDWLRRRLLTRTKPVDLVAAP